MNRPLTIAILDDHSITIDGYRARLAQDSALHILWTTPYGEDVAVRMDQQPVDVLILDVSVPTSAHNPNPYPILDVVPRLLERHPALTLLVISMHMESRLIKTVLRLGASGYVLKDDREALNRLDQVVRAAVAGDLYVSPLAARSWHERQDPADATLTPRQLQALSLCLAYPDETSHQLALRLGVTPVTLRNLLSGAYLRLNVRSRASAVAEAQRRGLITPVGPTPPAPAEPLAPAEPQVQP